MRNCNTGLIMCGFRHRSRSLAEFTWTRNAVEVQRIGRYILDGLQCVFTYRNEPFWRRLYAHLNDSFGEDGEFTRSLVYST